MLEEHLGGHQGKTHTDEGTLNWAIHYLDVKSMLDIGCGPGGMVELANNMGVDAFGVDGDYTLQRYDESKFLIHDFQTGPAPITKQADFATPRYPFVSACLYHPTLNKPRLVAQLISFSDVCSLIN